MTTSVYPIHRAINRPLTFKGLKGQYILYAAAGLIGDLLLFIILYCCHVSGWLCISIALGLGGGVLSICSSASRKYGVHGLQKLRAKRQLPPRLQWRTSRLLNNTGFPLLDVTSDGLLSKTGDFTICYEMTRPALHSLAVGQRDLIQQSFSKALKVFTDHVILYLQDHYFKLEPTVRQDDGAGTFLGTANVRHFSGAYMNNRCYCFLTLRARGRHRSGSGLTSLIRGSLAPGFVDNPGLLLGFRQQCDQFRAILTDSGLVQLRPLTGDELLGSPEKMGILESYCWMGSPDDRSLSDIELNGDIRMHGQTCTLYTLADAEKLPSQCSPHIRYEPYSTAATYFPTGFATGLGPLLDIEHYYNLYIFIDEPTRMLGKLETQRRRLKSLSGQSRENAVASEAIGQYLQEAAESQRQPVRVHCHVIAKPREGDTAGALQQRINSAITRIGAVPYLETLSAPQIWYAGIPGNAGVFPIEDSWLTFGEQATCFAVPETFDQHSNSGFGFPFGERQTGQRLHVDLSDEPMRKGLIGNRNKMIFGPSGSGKSFLMNLLVRNYIEQASHVVLVDVGGSYKGLCETLGGLYLTYTEEKPICFNPFRLDGSDRPDTEKKEMLMALLLAVSKKSGESFRRSEYVALSNAVFGYYNYLAVHRKTAKCFNSFYDYLRDEYAVTLACDKVKKEDFDLDHFLYVLRPYYRGGEYDYLLNAIDQPSLLHEPLVVFELDAVKDHPILFPVVTVIIMDMYISKMRQLNGVRKVIILEEAWKAIAKEGMAEFLKYLFKTVRKFFGEAIIVTQDIEDMISSPIVKNAIINNADCKILLDQSKFIHRFDAIQEALGLTEQDKAMVLSLNKANDPTQKYKEVFVGMANGPSKVYRVTVSLEERLTYTTEESEKVMVRKYADEQGGIQKGVAALARDIRSGAVKLLVTFLFCGLLTLIPQGRASAQALEVIEIVDAVVKKAIMAADLQVQRIQTQTIALQNAEKELENSMAGGLLDDITGWVQDQENLYSEYYQELWQVKSALSTYGKTATLIQRQVQLVKEEQQDWAAVQKDPHFSAAELSHIGNVYSGIINESARNVQQIEQVITAFVTQMDDASRLRIIDETSKGIDGNYADLRGFTQQNSLLSLQRARDQADILTIQSLYNIP